VTSLNWPGFEEGLRKNLPEFRSNHKDFLFTRGFRGFKVIDPSPALPNIAGESNIWGDDPVHSLTEGYERVVDLLEKEILMRSAAGSKKTASDSAGGQVKKPRMEVYRPSWIEGSSLTAKRNDVVAEAAAVAAVAVAAEADLGSGAVEDSTRGTAVAGGGSSLLVATTSSRRHWSVINRLFFFYSEKIVKKP